MALLVVGFVLVAGAGVVMDVVVGAVFVVEVVVGCRGALRDG